jgi:hypothetical protein
MESQYFGDLPAYRGPGSALEPVTIFLAHLQEGARAAGRRYRARSFATAPVRLAQIPQRPEGEAVPAAC